MSLTGNNVFAGASGHETNQPAFTIDQSLRFNDGDGSYLSKAAPGAAGNLDNWTVSGWFKRGQDTGLLSSSWEYQFFGQGDASPNPVSSMSFYGTASDIDKISIGLYGTSDSDFVCSWKSAALFRDHSAWYHVVVKWDNSQSAAADILKVYVNGEVVSGTFAVSPSQGTDTVVNKNFKQFLGKYVYNTQPNWWDGYMAEYHFIDGQSLTAASFGETDSNNKWVPIEYQGTYGTQGWYLNFSDSSSIGADSSGNGNNFTANALAATDVVLDSPSNNFCTLNPIFVSASGPGRESTLEQGNLKATTPTSGSGYNGPTMGTIGMASSKWYFEWYIGSSNYPAVGIAKADYNTGYAQPNVGNRVWLDGGSLYGVSSSSSGVTYTTGDIVGCAVDMDNGKMWFSKNGTFISSGDPAAGTNAQFTDLLSASDMGSTGQVLPFFSDVNWGTSDTVVFNAGQDSSFAGNKTSGAAGSDFYYTPPTGFKALNTDNLSDPSIADPTKHFNAVLYTGNSTGGRDITVGMAPDLVWCKNLTGNNHSLTDSVRGVNRQLASNSTANETTHTNRVTAFNSDGFTTGDSDDTNANNNGIISWNWKAGGAPTADNSAGAGATPTAGSVKIDGSNLGSALAGTIPAVRLSANTTSGFSIIIHDGTGSNGTLAHGLSQAPELVIAKPKTNSVDVWRVGSDYLTSWVKEIRLNQISAETDRAAVFNSLAPTSSVVNLGTDGANNGGGATFVTYCFYSVDGYSKVGSYTGNGNADGTFIYTGFRPAFVMTKSISSTGNWTMLDSAREPTNVASPGRLYADLSNGESDGATYDFVSNGFKCRETGGPNNSGVTYIYLAFAESPFKTSNAR